MRSQSAHCMLSRKLNPALERHNQTAHRCLTPSFHHTSQRHGNGRASQHATIATPCTCNHALLTASDRRRGHQQHTRNAIPHSHCSAAVTHACTQARHARTSRTAVATAHCTNITAHTQPHARHTQYGTQLRAPHTSPIENHTQPTHGPRATLTAELSSCPASTGCCRRVGCSSTAVACRT
jgi:hypothetical protein